MMKENNKIATNLLIQRMKTKMEKYRMILPQLAAQTGVNLYILRLWLKAAEPSISYEDAKKIERWLSGPSQEPEQKKQKAKDILLLNLEHEMAERKISLRQLAEQIGFNTSTVEGWLYKNASFNYECGLILEKWINEKPEPQDKETDPQEQPHQKEPSATDLLLQRLKAEMDNHDIRPSILAQQLGFKQGKVQAWFQSTNPSVKYNDVPLIEEWINRPVKNRTNFSFKENLTSSLFSRLKEKVDEYQIKVDQLAAQTGLGKNKLSSWPNQIDPAISYEEALILEKWINEEPKPVIEDASLELAIEDALKKDLEQIDEKNQSPTDILIRRLRSAMRIRRIKATKLSEKTGINLYMIRIWLRKPNPFINYENAKTIEEWIINGAVENKKPDQKKQRATDILLKRLEDEMQTRYIQLLQLAEQTGLKQGTLDKWLNKYHPTISYHHGMILEKWINEKPELLTEDAFEKEQTDEKNQSPTNLLVRRWKKKLFERKITIWQFIEQTKLNQNRAEKWFHRTNPYLRYDEATIIEEWISGSLQSKKNDPNKQTATDLLFQKLEDEMQERDLQLKQFAKQVGIHVCTIQEWMKKVNMVSYEKGLRIEKWINERPELIEKQTDPSKLSAKELLLYRWKTEMKARKIKIRQFAAQTGLKEARVHKWLGNINPPVRYDEAAIIEKWISGSLQSKKNDPNKQTATDQLLQRFQEVRQSRNITLVKFSVQTGIRSNTIYDWEKKRYMMRYEKGIIIEKWLAENQQQKPA